MLPLSVDSTTAVATPVDAQAPIGVFDSGVGGLSVLRHVRERLPQENLIYFADTLHAPYGGRSQTQIEARALAIGAFLVAQRVKAIVVACNTATAAAIAALRSTYPTLIVVGVEPGLKPAAALSRIGMVGVLATEATLASQRFACLRDQVSAQTRVQFVAQACPGLADLIETDPLESLQIRSLLHTLLLPLLGQRVDTIVLGCTHYSFVRAQIESLLLQHGAAGVAIVDTGAAVARQLDLVLKQKALHRNGRCTGSGGLAGFSSGVPEALDEAFDRLLGLQVVSRQG